MRSTSVPHSGQIHKQEVALSVNRHTVELDSAGKGASAPAPVRPVRICVVAPYKWGNQTGRGGNS